MRPLNLRCAIVAFLGALVLTPGALATGGCPSGDALLDLRSAEKTVWAITIVCDVAGERAWTLQRIDPGGRGVLTTEPLPGANYRLAIAGPYAWVTGNRLLRLDARTGRVLGAVTGLSGADQVTAGDEGVWALDTVRDRLWRVDPARARVSGRWSRPSRLRPLAVAVGAGSVWVTTWGARRMGRPSWDRGPGWLLRIDPVSRRVTTRTRVGRVPTALVMTTGVGWVANSWDGTIIRIRPATGRPLGPPTTLPGARRGRQARDLRIAADNDDAWITDGSRLWRVDAGTGHPTVAASVRPPTSIEAITSGPNGTWLGLQDPQGPLRLQEAPAAGPIQQLG